MDPRVLEAMLPFLLERFGNANSQHSFGAEAWEAVEHARTQVSRLLGAEDPSQIVFTSGATESNNWVMRSFPSGWVSPFEHSSVLEPAQMQGFQMLPNNGLELGSPAARTDLVSCMAVNNEIGAQWDPGQFVGLGAKVHSDMTQAVSKVQTSLSGLDYVSFSAHKLYGPKGVGALYIRDGSLTPMIAGGGQENGLRSGTLNVAGIVGMGAACERARLEFRTNLDHAYALNGIVLEEMRGLADCQANGGARRSPYILSLSFRGVEGEALVVDMDARGYAISSGAACSSRSTEPSHVLVALDMPEDWLRGTVRISFGRFNTVDQTAQMAKTLRQCVEKLRTMT